MSVLNQSGEEQVECPLCMEPLEVDDLHFYPCTCGYQICRFCWNRIREIENGLCPACRKAYPENPADFTPLSQEQVAAIKTEKRAREQRRRNKTLESRRALANVRVVQNNLVFVVGLPVRLADPEILKRQEYFGKYGKIHKVVINQSTTYAGSQGPSASAYVTYVSGADALRAIQGVNNVTLDGRVLKGSLGTTKYCANFMKNQPCPKPDCMYLHELGDPKASFTKEEMHAGLHQVYERKLHNQLLAQTQKEKATATDDKNSSSSTGNSSSNGDKGSSKDGTQSNFIPTTVVTSSHINVVNSSSSSSRSKKESGGSSGSNGSSGSSGSSGSGSSGSSASSKEAWPSLGSSPPSDTPLRKMPSPKPQNTAKSQENGTSESNSPTQMQPSQPQPTQPAHTKQHKDNHTADTGKTKAKENGTNHKKTKHDKTKRKNSPQNNPTETHSDTEPTQTTNTQSSVFETDKQDNYIANEIDELESERHNLLETHELLDNGDSLIEDDTHNLLNDANNEVLMLQRHREMLAGLVDTNHLMAQHQYKNNLVNGYGLSDREIVYMNDRQTNQMGHMMRQGDLLRRHEPKHYAASSIAMDSSDLLGANYHANHNMLPFGMRVDNSIASTMASNHLAPNTMASNHLTNSMSANALAANSMSANALSANSMSANALSANALAANALAANSMSANAMSANSMSGNLAAPYLMHNQQLLHSPHMQQATLNGYDSPHASEGRYLAENMDKFFTDFHKAQQMRVLLGRGEERRVLPHNMLSAERLEMEHKQRMGVRVGMGMEGGAGGAGGAGRAAGDADDDLDFDPFKETQKALAEMMESEMMQGNVSSGDNMERVRRSRMPPPGFGHMQYSPRPHPLQQQQGYTTGSAMFSDWTQMDPAIMSTSVGGKQQQELIARFSQLGGAPAPHWGGASRGLWGARVPLPPGFASPPSARLSQECIDAK